MIENNQTNSNQSYLRFVGIDFDIFHLTMLIKSFFDFKIVGRLFNTMHSQNATRLKFDFLDFFSFFGFFRLARFSIFQVGQLLILLHFVGGFAFEIVFSVRKAKSQ